MAETEQAGSKVVALWLKTGKRIDTSPGIIMAEKGFVVRLGERNTLVIPPGSVVAIECHFDTVEAVDKVFNG